MFWQVCYTSVPGKGWTTLNASPGLPAEAMEQFSRLHGAYAQEPDLHKDDKRTLYLLQSDAGYVYYSAVHYGFSDAFGRASMFVQGFVFPLAQFAENPDRVLTVARSNFRFGVEESSVPLTELERITACTVPEALAELGLNPQGYFSLMQCIWHAFDRQHSDPIQIVCDCREESIYAVLRVICAALPEPLRKRLSYASAESARSAAGQRITFSRQASSAGRRFILATGEETILSRAAQRQLDACGFLQEAVTAAATSGDAGEVFAKLDSELALHGAKGAVSLELLAFAQTKRLLPPLELLEEDALQRHLGDFLTIDLPNREQLDGLCAGMLHRLLDLRCPIDAILSEQIAQRQARTAHPAFQEAGLRYLVDQLKSMPGEAACAYLGENYPDRRAPGFLALRAALEQDEAGQAVVSHYYQLEVASEVIVSTEPENVTDILSYYKETESLAPRADFEQRVLDWLREHYRLRQEENTSPREAVQLQANAETVIAECFPGHGGWVDLLWESIRLQFWTQFQWKNFDLSSDDELRRNYDRLRLKGNTGSQLAYCLYHILSYFEQEDYINFLRELADYRNRKLPGTDHITKLFIARCLEDKENLPPDEITFWYALACWSSPSDSQRAAFLLGHEFPAFEEKRFLPAMERFRAEAEPNDLTALLRWLSAYAANKTPEGKYAAALLEQYRRSEKRRLKQQAEERSQSGPDEPMFDDPLGRPVPPEPAPKPAPDLRKKVGSLLHKWVDKIAGSGEDE